MTLKLSLFFRPYQVPGSDLKAFLAVAKAADAAGLYSLCFGDHLLIGNHPENYPYGPFKHNAASAWMEPLTTLAAMAAVTEKLILGTAILLSPLRPPVLLAKTIATLDVIAEGRTQLALGVGWQREEYEALNVPWDQRYARLDEGVRACRAIWGEQPVTFESENLKLDRIWAYPRPIQSRPPLLFGIAMTPKNAKRIAEIGDGWCPVGLSSQDLRAGIDRLAEATAAAGRSMSEMHIRAPIPPVLDGSGKIDVRKTLAQAPAFIEAGATSITVGAPTNPESMGEIFQFVEDLARISGEMA